MLVVYPEKNPFDIKPPVLNLTPLQRDNECAYDVPEFIVGAQSQATRTGLNPLDTWYGTNPLIAHVGSKLYPAWKFDELAEGWGLFYRMVRIYLCMRWSITR